jgi:2'-5' RNA ligase
LNDLPPRVRAFVALRMGSEVERALARLIAGLQTEGDGIRWVRPENLHITIRFLGGAADSSMLGPLSRSLRDIAVATHPFEVGAKGVGVFPNRERPRVLWVGLEGAALIELARRVEEAAVRCGFEPESRPYSAHLTIARVNDSRNWKKIRPKFEAATAHDFGASMVEAMTLYRSIPRAAGTSYVELATFAFDATAAAHF